MNIGNRIIKLSEKLGVTPYEISKKTGISQATLSRLINNETTKPNIKNAEILANYFNVSKEWLLTGKDNEINKVDQNYENISNENNVKQRLKQFIEYKKISVREFERKTNLSNGYVNGIEKTIMPKKMSFISLQFPELNIGWLLTGEGKMLKEENESLQEPGIIYEKKSYQKDDVGESINPKKLTSMDLNELLVVSIDRLTRQNEKLINKIEELERELREADEAPQKKGVG